MCDTALAAINTQGLLTTGLVGLLVALAMFVVSNLVLIAVVVVLPADFFCHAPPDCAAHGRRKGIYLILIVAKNLIGLLILLLGLVLVLPGVPGPGLVAILIGLAMLDFPGKRQLERKLLGYRGVLPTVNRLRARFGRAPLVLADPSSIDDAPRNNS